MPEHRTDRRMKNSPAHVRDHRHSGQIGTCRVLKSKRGDFYAQATLKDMSGTMTYRISRPFKRIGDSEA